MDSVDKVSTFLVKSISIVVALLSEYHNHALLRVSVPTVLLATKVSFHRLPRHHFMSTNEFDISISSLRPLARYAVN